MRVQIKKPASVAVNGKLKEFTPGQEVTLPQDAAMRLIRTLCAIRLSDQVTPVEPQRKSKASPAKGAVKKTGAKSPPKKAPAKKVRAKKTPTKAAPAAGVSEAQARG